MRYVVQLSIDWDMVFPDDEREANPASFKFLEMAHKWKRMQQTAASSNDKNAMSLASNTEHVESRPSPSADLSGSNTNDDNDTEMANSNSIDE